MLAEYKTLTGTINQKAVNKHILAKLCFRKMAGGNARETLHFHVGFSVSKIEG
jgi:hypothetical protein